MGLRPQVGKLERGGNRKGTPEGKQVGVQFVLQFAHSFLLEQIITSKNKMIVLVPELVASNLGKKIDHCLQQEI